MLAGSGSCIPARCACTLFKKYPLLPSLLFVLNLVKRSGFSPNAPVPQTGPLLFDLALLVAAYGPGPVSQIWRLVAGQRPPQHPIRSLPLPHHHHHHLSFSLQHTFTNECILPARTCV